MQKQQLHANWIGGAWAAAQSASPNINPSDLADVVGEYAAGDSASVKQAVDAARAAFPAWSTATPQQDRKSTRLNSSHIQKSRMPSSA